MVAWRILEWRYPAMFEMRQARPQVSPGRLAGIVAIAALCPSACKSAAEYGLEADEEVYRILNERRAAFTRDPGSFQVDPPEDSLRQQLLRGERLEDALALLDCLEIGAENSRDFQSRRESLFRAALDLTLDRFNFSVQESGVLAGLLDGQGGELTASELESDLGLSRLLGTGASIVGNIGLSLFRLAGSGEQASLSSDLSLSVTQPLLRGFGPDIVLENLTQSERDVIYAVREYERFRRSFAVDVAGRFFRVLQQADALRNQIANAEMLRILRERNEAFAEAGQLSEIQADQARQDELRAQSAVISARQSLEALYDDFKFFLGLPIGAALELDPDELELLRVAGMTELPVGEEAVLAFALSHRLDLHTVWDRVEDAQRAVAIAIDSLRPGLGLSAGASSSSEPDRALDHNIDSVSWNLDLLLDLPLDRLPQRNTYRALLLSLRAAERSAEALEDAIVADLRDALRDLRSRAEDYRIQELTVLLNTRRVDSSNLNLQAGRAQTRDVLEAQEDLVSAQNAATAALVDYYLSSLALNRDMETLRVDATGIHFEQVSAPDASAGAAGI